MLYHSRMTRGLAVGAIACWLGAMLTNCSSSTSKTDASSKSDAVADTGRPTDAHDGPVCSYQNYSETQYQGFVDGGTFGNLPCGGCAPSSGRCSPDGVAAGHLYECWAEYLYPQPPGPGTGCAAIGVKVDGVDPTVWDVCCR